LVWVLLLRGRAGLTQRALAARLGIGEQAIHKWEAGQGYPGPTRLQALIALYLQHGVFTAGCEAEEARALWKALCREAAHRMSLFDSAWFARLRPAMPEVVAGPTPLPARASTPPPERSQWQAWSEAPEVAGFPGRRAEGAKGVGL
jgi:transcriptional regulator with XRE-family HTH domain